MSRFARPIGTRPTPFCCCEEAEPLARTPAHQTINVTYVAAKSTITSFRTRSFLPASASANRIPPPRHLGGGGGKEGSINRHREETGNTDALQSLLYVSCKGHFAQSHRTVSSISSPSRHPMSAARGNAWQSSRMIRRSSATMREMSARHKKSCVPRLWPACPVLPAALFLAEATLA
jgi:hypothetical protein